MKDRAGVRIAFGVVLACVVAFASAFAYGEIPAADPSARDPDSAQGVSHHWVQEAAGFAPYTEASPSEQAALRVAKKALSEPSAALVRNADRGYEVAKRQVVLARLLKGSEPTNIGHELIVWSGERAARVYVSRDGLIRVLESGPLIRLLPTWTKAAEDHEDQDAAEIVAAASELGAALGGSAPGDANSLVSAHVVGFANDSGLHQVLRIGIDNSVSRTEW